MVSFETAAAAAALPAPTVEPALAPPALVPAPAAPTGLLAAAGCADLAAPGAPAVRAAPTVVDPMSGGGAAATPALLASGS